MTAPADPLDALDPLEDAFHRTPRCALHPERDARRAPCARCGSYACEACFVTETETLCSSCRERVGAGLAWERDPESGSFARLWATVVEALPSPFTVFEGVRDGSLGSALAFATLINLLSYGAPMLLCGPCLVGLVAYMPAPDDVPRSLFLAIAVGLVVFVPFLMTAVQLLVTAALGTTYHLAARLAGGSASFVASLRAMLFTNVLAPIGASSWFLGRIPVLGVVFSLAAYVGSVVWQTFALAGHAQIGRAHV